MALSEQYTLTEATPLQSFLRAYGILMAALVAALVVLAVCLFIMLGCPFIMIAPSFLFMDWVSKNTLDKKRR